MKWSNWIFDSGAISGEQLDEAVSFSESLRIPVPDALLELGYSDAWTITQAFAAEFGYPVFNFYQNLIPPETIRTVPDIIVADLKLCPVMLQKAVLWYATPRFIDDAQQTKLRLILNRDVRPMWTSKDWIEQAYRSYYSDLHVTFSGVGIRCARYTDEDWILAEGNCFHDYMVAREATFR